ncbi:uncharacterized protein METZ01_LOCUS176460, partial [marine metagenome]
MSKRKPSTDLYPSSLLLEAHKVLGEEFSRLPERIQIGFTTTFWNHSNIIKHNKHNRKPDSFAMGKKEIVRNFTDPRDFRKVNDNGYSLRPKRTRHGSIESKNILCKERTGGATSYPPTKWLDSTAVAFSGGRKAFIKGSKNGFQLSPKIQQLVDDWFEKPIEEISASKGMVNRNGESALEIASDYGGAIIRDISRVSKRTNISVIINININSLLMHKEELSKTQTKTAEEEAKGRGDDKEALGGVKVNNSSTTLTSKGFTLE